MFSVNALSMVYGDRILFRDVTLHFNKGRRYGLVGANGSGKTTFLKILSGRQLPTSGSVQIPKGATVGILEQDFFRFEEIPILDLVLMGDRELWEALKKKEALLSLDVIPTEHLDTLSDIEALLAMKGGYRAEAKAAQILSGLGIDVLDHRKPLRTLSGGYQLRVLLSQLLFLQPDLLLLDEPTNYLDLFSIQWLGRYLTDYPGTLILSSHDRYFLNQVCHDMIDIDYGEIRRYKGDFEHFIREKAKEVETKGAVLASYAKRKKDIQRFIERFQAKASKARQAGSRERMIEKLEAEEKNYEQPPSSRQYPHFHFEIERPSAQRVLKVEGISKAFGKRHVLKNIQFEVAKQEKVALVGVNGVGKSTLLEILTGYLNKDTGLYKWGVHVHWAYFPQNFQRILNPEATVYDWLHSVSQEASEEKVRRVLGQLLFGEHAQTKKIRCLSGGEAARLVFAFLILKEHNTIILDEPTNHLDMESTEALIEALKEYKGTLLIVSHNRYFISQVANRIVELHGEAVSDFHGGYGEFVEKHEKDYLDRKAPQSKKKQVSYEKKKEERRVRNRLKREVERLEQEIPLIESEIQKINERLSSAQFYEKTPKKELQNILNERDTLEEKKDLLYKKWEEKQESLDR